MNISYRGFVRVSKKTLALMMGFALLSTGFTFFPVTSLHAATVLGDGFGTGNDDADIDNWNEEGNDNDSSTLAKKPTNSGEDIASPDGGRFAKIGEDEWICRQIDAAGYYNLTLKYYWNGDEDTENNTDYGIVEYRATSNGNTDQTCNSNSNSWTQLASHDLYDDRNWSPLQTINLPDELDNDSSWFIRFRNNASNDDEYFRVDGVLIEGTPPDTTAPTVTIDEAAGQDDPTPSTASSVNFEVEFSEAVTGFDANDVTLGGTAGATTKSVTGGPTSYNVQVGGWSTHGTVTISVPAGAAKDASNNDSDFPTIVGGTGLGDTVTVNAKPVAHAQGPIAVAWQDSVNFTLSGSDADNAPVSPLTFEPADPSTGSLVCVGADCTFDHNTGTYGADSFTFRVFDGLEYSEPATVSLEVSGPNTPTQCVAVSNAETLAGGVAAVPTYVHPNWTTGLTGVDGATWIWNAAEASQSELPETVVFTRTISLTGNPTSATLQIASDNQYAVSVNGNPVAACDGTAENNFGAVESCSIPLVAGDNTLAFTVTNALPAGTYDSNPAGLIYRVVAADVFCGAANVTENSCVLPEANENASVVLGAAPGVEDTLQEILDGAGAPYNTLDADDDQTGYEVWNGSGETVHFTATFLDKWAANGHVFGYFLNGSDTFVPVFRNSISVAPAYEGVEDLVPGESTTFTVYGVEDIAFAIADWNNSTNTFYSTDSSENPDAQVHALVYNPDDNKYVLAFEDLAIPDPSDEDYNDFVIALSVDKCEDGAVCEPGVELIKNGGFETPSVSHGSGWDIFASGHSGLEWVTEWFGGAASFNEVSRPEIANLEIHGGVNGWLPSEGEQYAELDTDWNGHTGSLNGEPASVAISQTIPTVPGETYTLTFDFSPRPNQSTANNALDVLVNGDVLETITATSTTVGNQTEWTTFEFSFEADAYLSTLTLRDAGTPNSEGTFVDNVSFMCAEEVDEPTCNPEAQKVLLSSDASESGLLTLDESGAASLVASPHASWFAPSEGAWIWKDTATSVNDAANGAEETFTRTFTIIGTPEDSTLTLAADNGYEVLVNGQSIECADSGEFNYAATVDCAVPASVLENGLNTITFTVTNMDHESYNDPANNPAGLYFKLVVNENECEIPEPDYEKGEGTLIIKKVTQYEENGTFDFDIGGNETFFDADIVANNGVGETSLVLQAGTYSVTETQQEDWEFVSVTCDYEGESEGENIAYGKQITISDGETVTCTFVNAYDEDNGGSGRSRNGGPSNDGGSVLGAVAGESESCGPLLSTYMRIGIDNNGEEVTKLQNFLNEEMSSGLPVTGVFGPLTDAAVRAFQIKYWEDVLQPWFGLEGSAIQDQDDSTGFVYKTTKWKINNIWCPGSEEMPLLP